MPIQFRRVAIVNRGEPAMRFIRAVREFNHENEAALRTIALFTDPDRHAFFVRKADESYCLGAPLVTDPLTGQLRSAYLDYDILQKALIATRAEAVWVGWGFVAEHADFADLCRDLGIVYIGPSGDVMRRLGDKITSKLLAEQAHVPVAPWSGGPVDTLDDARHHANRLGYPLLIKATAGGGGRGIQRVDGPDDLPRAFESARNAAFKSFGNPTVFLEQLVVGARHIEVQVVGDHYGNVWAAGVRDCTIQRRHQKVLEEAPSPVLTADEDQAVREAAVRLAKQVGYENAGTVEFLYRQSAGVPSGCEPRPSGSVTSAADEGTRATPAVGHFFFMEMNTRLQVEHPVTEATTGLDLVKLQISIAFGEPLTGDPPPTTGHAVEVRLNAENTDEGFQPAPGRVEQFRIPCGPGVRLESGVVEGEVIPAEFDSMIAKLIGYGRTRDEAMARLRRLLSESVVVIKGGASNRTFLLDLLGRPEVRAAEYDIGWLDRLTKDGAWLSHQHSAVALIHAAIEAYMIEAGVEEQQFYASAARGRPQVRSGVGQLIELRYRGNGYKFKVHRLGAQDFRVFVDKSVVDARLEWLGDFEYWLTCFGRRHHLISVNEGLTYAIEVEGVSHRISRDDAGIVRSPAPAVVVALSVSEGDEVNEGDQIAVLEAMKMEMPVRAPFKGKVRQLLTMPYVQVPTGAPLLQIDPAAEGEIEGGKRVSFDAAIPVQTEPDPEAWAASLDELKQLMLGYDVDPAQAARLIETWKSAAPTGAARHREDQILEIFADICDLFDRSASVPLIHPAAFVSRDREGANDGAILSDRPSAESNPDREGAAKGAVPGAAQSVTAEQPSPEACLFAYLRSITTKGEGLPTQFLTALKRALAHYNIATLDRTPDLEQALLCIYKSHQRFDVQVAPILALLQRRLDTVPLDPKPDDRLRDLLSRMISAARDRFPAVSDLAREVRYRYFDQPLFESARQRVFERADHCLAWLAADPDAPESREKIRELIDCPQPLVGLFARRFPFAAPALRETMLQVLTMRYYRTRDIAPIRAVPVDGFCAVNSDYTFEGKRIHVFAAYTSYIQIPDALRALAPHFAAIPESEDIVVDLLVGHRVELGPDDALEAEIRGLVVQAGVQRRIRRVVIAIASARENGAMRYFTYRPSDSGYAEDRFYRGLHPMLGKRMHLWRLENFDLTRLPSEEDIFLLHAVAKTNPKDERLFGCAEIRDLTPVRDENGRIVQLPHIERMFSEVAAGIRRFQAARPVNKRLHWNRVLLYVWPAVHITADELNDIVHRVAPESEGLGLEQVAIQARVANPETGELRDTIIRLQSRGGSEVAITFRSADHLEPLQPLSDYTMKVVKMRQRGLNYPYEIVKMMTPARDDTGADYPPGDFVEYDLDADNRLVPVNRPYGENKANIIVGIIRNFTAKYPEGMARVAVFGDPSKDLGALAEPECRRINAALELATRERVPVEWYALSAGAKISMNSGVENMDWIALVLRRIVEFTQAGGEINVLVDGINVGAQPYWNAEATMLMHTRGILVMTPKAAMVLTGKRALDYSGGVSADDNQGIGGYDRIMGPNGQAQYFAHDIDECCRILLRHYDHTYVMPGERFPRRAVTTDPIDRDVRTAPHVPTGDCDFTSVGDILSDATNAGRKKSFDIRQVMKAAIDQDHLPMERFAGMRDAETTVVWDAHLGGIPVCMIGIESRPLPRLGFVPADGPDQWTSGTLFPMSSKKVARAVNAASNNRPVCVLANLTGFDGSPESLRKLQLEYGAEIGRAVVNFKGPIVFCVVSRYHGGAYVVFSGALNDNLEIAALEGTYASVIGGAPAAAVVFASEVEARTRKDPRLVELSDAMAKGDASAKSNLRRRYDELFKQVHSEKLGEMAEEFDNIHSVERALKVGALNRIIAPGELRPYLIDALERGMARCLAPTEAHAALAAAK